MSSDSTDRPPCRRLKEVKGAVDDAGRAYRWALVFRFLQGAHGSAPVTPQEQMIQIGLLRQNLHGQGPLAPLFIEGTKRAFERT